MNDADIVFVFFFLYNELLLLLILCQISAQTDPTKFDLNRQVTR